MMRTLGLVLALLVVASGMSVAASVTVDLYSKWNYISCPLVPFNPDPNAVFTGPTGDPLDIDTLLLRYDGPSQGQVGFDAGDPGSFGNILLGDGYILNNYAGVDSFTYQGVPDGVPDVSNNKTDMWISLPGGQGDTAQGGWHLIGQPFNHDTAVNGDLGTGDHIWFTDGTTLKTWDEAVTAGWVDDTMFYFEAAAQGQGTLSYGGGDDDSLRAGKAYYVRTKKDNLALIIPAD